MFTDSMGQEFSKSAVETACLCCTVSGAFNQEYFKGVIPQPGAGIIWKHLHIRAWQLILPIGCDLSSDCQQKYLTEASPCGLVFLIEQQLLTGQIF